MPTPTEFKLSGCRARYEQGTILLESDRDPSDRFVWSVADVECAVRVFRHLAPELARALGALASVARIARVQERRGQNE